MSIQFNDHVFISYAHIDNEPLVEGQEGWVQLLEKVLRKRLRQLLGEDVKIWRDPKLQGNDEFSEILMVRVGKAALLVSVLSPRYLKSDWCQRELDEFCKRAAENGGLSVGGKSRVFKVVKTFISRDRHPETLKGTIGYEFYEYDESTGRAREFSTDVTPQKDQRYWNKLEDLAQDIKLAIESLDTTPPPPPTTTVYLAETTSDLNEARDRIKRDLMQLNVRVLPDQALPLKADALAETVREGVRQSAFSIHPIGAYYGIIPEKGEKRSTVRLQCDLARQRAEDPHFKQFIWIPPGMAAKEPEQQQFINELLDDPGNAEVLQTALEDLKNIIQEQLAPSRRPAPAEKKDDQPLRIYLVYDRNDSGSAAPIRDFLFEREFEVLEPWFGDDQAQSIEEHNANLTLCDAVLYYYGNVGEMWWRMKLNELRKLPGYNRARPMLAKAVLVASPKTPEKERLKTREMTVIKAYDNFTLDLLTPFLETVRQNGELRAVS